METRRRKNLRGLYRGDLRLLIMHNKRKMKEELEENKDKKVKMLANFDFLVPVASVLPVTEALTVYKQLKNEGFEEIHEVYENISEMIKPPVSSDSELCKFALFEVSEHIVVKEYFQRLLNNCKKIEASEKAAEIFWTTSSKYCGETVRGWAKEFLQFGKVSDHQQGKHAKRSSIVDDEDLKKKAIVWLCTQKAERRTVVNLKKYLDEMLFPSCLGNNQNVYYNGHKRQDVVQYHHAWATRMMGYKQCMSDFTGEDEKIEEGESHICKKGQGRSLMVSKFQCACHGTMQLKNHAIPLFESLHKGCTSVFIFDQSSNHKVYATDVLVATHMILKPKVVSENDKFVFKDTTFLKDGRIIPQLFYETVFEVGRKRKGPVEKRQFVGVQQILQKHGLASPVAGSPSMIRRFYKKTWRYIEAYSKFLDAKNADAEVKKFTSRISKSHHSIGIHD
ncbi:hypothetical protein PHYBLDRAFT_151658 [Phycomyces blakesleeanus NRRL 1555(-)]|uniref:Uncharacterized protein n=1 Tax=Phycomyces blakesleeanus (strain ATCC 8743b / DSM 1359 / FGSC 10004 / NBRC 33097 / NRRL 1555) TaxID=763407 RepID=A0A167K753_PHYB8|nr:hypothetical protein PHYBLDRAFT_151658 [Phycomyces blakesleeanus NRRL 1555(-)]OAD67406.1 hypothetical protein PHYBLDRAFT_151658 [Phycomyces blakesleeanus NRRL 1555(-)]|eukprot:XP_018285446.1 hypothetical protein PHYBLDRAFT_151658 [Phycomyces blakesleeanus NRRL 1555(-)]